MLSFQPAIASPRDPAPTFVISSLVNVPAHFWLRLCPSRDVAAANVHPGITDSPIANHATATQLDLSVTYVINSMGFVSVKPTSLDGNVTDAPWDSGVSDLLDANVSVLMTVSWKF